MATEKAPTRDELMEELSKKGINNLVELLDAIMPDETGGFTIDQTDGIYPQDSNPHPGNLARRQGRGPDGAHNPYYGILQFLQWWNSEG